MKIEPEIVEKLTEGILERQKSINKAFADFYEGLVKATTVEEIMQEKSMLLMRLVDSLPTDNNECYFCILHHRVNDTPDCGVCEYGVVHGVCFTSESDFGKIREAKSILMDKIDRLYYKTGEIYLENQKVITNV